MIKTTKLKRESYSRGVKRLEIATLAETRLRGGMASRQGGSFNSVLGRRKSPPVSPSSDQQRNNLRGEKYTKIKVSELTFLSPGRRRAPGSLCLWGTLFCLGGRPPSRSFFIAISSVRSSRPRPSRTPTALLLNATSQPSLVRGGRGGAKPD